jgi:2-hydroxychromene-2-carboxylate isomerase
VENVISLSQRREDRSHRTVQARFFFALDSPLSYLMSERVERALGDITWVPVLGSLPESDGIASRAQREHRAADCMRVAEREALLLEMPLVEPEPFPLDSRRATRAAMFAARSGACRSFALAIARLAFCGGFDISEDSVIAEAAAVARLDAGNVLAAASDARFEPQLSLTTRALWARGIDGAPAISVGDSWFDGADAIPAALSFRAAQLGDRRSRSSVGG